MNDSTNLSKGLLVLRYPERLPMEKIERLIDIVSPVADALGLEPMVLDAGADARIETGRDALLSRIADALEALVRQGEPPTVSEAQIAPQALNVRPTGLNSRTPNYQPPTELYGSTGSNGIIKKGR